MHFKKTRYQNCLAQTDAEMRALTFDFVIRRQSHLDKYRVFAGILHKDIKVCGNKHLAG